MDSDNEMFNMDKVNGITAVDYLKRAEEQLLSTNTERWSQKFTNESLQKFPANNKAYQECALGLVEIQKKFVLKHSNLKDNWTDKPDLQIGLTALHQVHQCCLTPSPPKIQAQVLEAFWAQCGEFAQTTSEANTVAGEVIGANLTAMAILYEPLQKKAVLTNTLPHLIAILKHSNGNVAESLKSPISTYLGALANNAKNLMSENAVEFWKIGIKTRNTDILYPIAVNSPDQVKPVLSETVDEFFDIFENDVSSAYRSGYFQLFTQISLVCPEKLFKHIDIFEDEIDGINKYAVCTVLQNLAKIKPDEIFKYMPQFKSVSSDQHMGYLAANVLGEIGKNTKSDDITKKCIEFTIEQLIKNESANMISVVIGQKNIAMGGENKRELYKSNYLPQIEKQLKHEDGNVVEQTNQLLDLIHGRNLENLENKMEDMKKELMSYVDSKIEDIKKNYNNKVKTLPMPVDIEVKKSVMNTIFLKFECAMHKDENCEYPGHNAEDGEYFKTKTKEVNKWCKIGASAFSLGKSIMTGDVGGALGALAETFSAAQADDQGKKHFKALMEEPFLTSSESDRLILQMREAHYFDHFNFDSNSNGWVCGGCIPFEKKTEEPKRAGTVCCTIF